MSGRDKPTPGGTHSYIDLYTRLLEAVQPKLVLEWGPGPNTTMALQSGSVVVSVEQDQQYLLPPVYNYVPMIIPVADPRYILPCNLSIFDLFFVDSRRRQALLINIKKHKKEEALVVIHDAQRLRYQDAIRLYDVIDRGPGTAVLK